MVFYKPQQQRVRAGARRIGQANNAQQLPLGPRQQGIQQVATAGIEFLQQQDLNPPDDIGVLLAAAGTPNLENEAQSLNAIEANTGLDIDVATADDGTNTVVVTAPSGAQSFLTLPAQPAVQPVQQAQCEFPAQDVQLERQVTITNTLPQLAGVDTDICGNVVGYRETMTRQIQAGPWLPISGLNGLVDNIQDVNGVLESGNFGANVTYANSPGLQAGPPVPNVVSQQLVGRGRRAVGGANRNVAYGVNAMRKFRSA